MRSCVNVIESVGKYRILELIGRGGTGAVYKALDPVLKRVVAIKVIAETTGLTDERRARFFREARAAANLSHRNIVTVYDLGEDHEHLFLVMEFLEGEVLRRHLSGGPALSVDAKLALMIQVCDALAYAHARGVVHRGVEPANLFVRRDGTVKILDFGMARVDGREDDLTRTGRATGNLSYMSPEQARGNVDARSDMFSAGAVFYELFTSRAPVMGSDPLGILAELSAPGPLSVFRADPAIPGDLAPVIERMLRKDPDARFPGMADVRNALDGVRGRRPLREGGASAGTTVAEQGREVPQTPGPSGTEAALAEAPVEVLPALEPAPGPVAEREPELPAPEPVVAPETAPAIRVERRRRRRLALGGVALVLALTAGWLTTMSITTSRRQRAEVAQARQRAAVSREEAVKAEAPLLAKALFEAAEVRYREGQQWAGAGGSGPATGALQEAAAGYANATRAARDVQKIRAGADRARADMLAKKKHAVSGTPEFRDALAREHEGEERYRLLAFADAADRFEAAARLFEKALPPPAAPAPPVVTDDEIREVLRQYARAFETKDLALLKQVRPGLRGAELTRHRAIFNQVQSYQLTLTVDAVTVKGDEAEAKGRREDVIVTRNGQTVRSPGEFRFRLRRVDDRWQIVAVK